MSVDATTIHDPLPPGPRFALNACALTLGVLRGPTLLHSEVPAWEHSLRGRIGDQLFTLHDAGRPPALAWTGAVWLEPQRRSWRRDLEMIAAELPPGALLSIVSSLPAGLVLGSATSSALGVRPTGTRQLRRALVGYGFQIEHSFGFHTPWWSALRWVAGRIRARRPDWSDRLLSGMRSRFATRGLGLPLAAAGLIQARAGMPS